MRGGHAEVLSAGRPGARRSGGLAAAPPGPLADESPPRHARGRLSTPSQATSGRAGRAPRGPRGLTGLGARVARPGPRPRVSHPGSRRDGLGGQLFRGLGRLLAMEGRSLGALQAALRVGARVTWQRLQEQARQGHGNPEAFARIGEAVFWYMDELAASCSAGYAEARAELAGETSQLRRHLLDMLTSSAAPPVPAVASLAQAVGWPLPRRVAAVALTPLAGGNPGPLPPDVLADLTRRDPCLLIADPDGPGRRRQLATALRGWLRAASHPGASPPPPGPLAAVGPPVPLTGASGSLRWAVQALALARRGLVSAGERCRRRGRDHLVRGPPAHARPAGRRRPGGDAQPGGARAAAAAAPRPGRPAGEDAARLAGERRRRQRRRPPAARPPADHPLPAAAGQRAVRRRADRPGRPLPAAARPAGTRAARRLTRARVTARGRPPAARSSQRTAGSSARLGCQ